MLLRWMVFCCLVGSVWADPVLRVVQGKALMRDDQPAWQEVPDHMPLSPTLQLWIQPEGQVEIQWSDQQKVLLWGPSQLRWTQYRHMDYTQPFYVFSQWNGWTEIQVEGARELPLRMLCGVDALEHFQGKAHVFCQPDSMRALVWLHQGHLDVQRNENHHIRLDQSRIWLRSGDPPVEQWLDSVQAVELLKRWSPSIPLGDGPQPVGLKWLPGISESKQSPWQINAFVEKSVRELKGFQNADEHIEWVLEARVKSFDILPSKEFWRYRIRVEMQLRNQKFSFQSRSLVFEKEYQANNRQPNRLALLRILPLECHNTHIRQSILGKSMRDLREFVQKNVLNPFMRGGIDPYARSGT